MKSWRIASARAAAAGSGMVVFFHRLAALPRSSARRISRAIRLRMPTALAAQLGVDRRDAVTALRPLVLGRDPGDQLGVLPVRSDGAPARAA